MIAALFVALALAASDQPTATPASTVSPTPATSASASPAQTAAPVATPTPAPTRSPVPTASPTQARRAGVFVLSHLAAAQSPDASVRAAAIALASPETLGL